MKSSERPLRIVGFGGTQSATSSSVTALRLVLDAAAGLGAETELFELGRLEIPIYEWGVAPTLDVARLADALHSADAIVWSSPLYHGSVSGAFKNAVDWLEILRDRTPSYLTDKPIGLVGVAGGGQALHAISTMEAVARALRAWTVPLVVPIQRASEVFDREGRVVDARVEAQLRSLGAELVKAARRFRD